MATDYKSIDSIIRAGVPDAIQNAPSFVSNEAISKLKNVQGYDDFVRVLKDDLNLDDATAHHTASTTIYGVVSRSGLNPLNWFPELPIGEQSKVKYGPAEYNQAIKYFKDWSRVQQFFFLLSTVAGIAIAAVGLPEAIGTVSAIRAAMLAGEGISAVANLVKIRSILALPKLLIPGLTAGIAWLGGQFAQTQLTATGDLLTYVRQNVARNEEEITKAETQKLQTAKGASPTTTNLPRFIIRMAETKKPLLFSGVMFSSALSKAEAFNRVVDDAITDLDDLNNDLKLNMTQWLKGLGGRISVAIAVRNNPIISASERLSGTWIVASLSYNLVDGGRVFLDTIPLGPIDPVKYIPTVSTVKTLEQQITGMFKTEDIKEIHIPESALHALTKEGEIVPILPKPSAAATTATPAAATPAKQETTPAPAAPAAAPSVNENIANIAESSSSGFVPVSAPAPTPVAAARYPNAVYPALVYGLVQRGRGIVAGPQATTNLRDAPKLSSSVVGTVNNGTEIIVFDYEKTTDGFDWMRVSVNGRTSWIAGSHLKVAP